MRLYKHTQTPGVYMPAEMTQQQESSFDQMNYNAAVNFVAHSRHAGGFKKGFTK